MSDNVRWHAGEVSRETRSEAALSRGCTVWLTGFSGSGKSTIAHRLEAALVEAGGADVGLGVERAAVAEVHRLALGEPLAGVVEQQRVRDASV